MQRPTGTVTRHGRDTYMREEACWLVGADVEKELSVLTTRTLVTCSQKIFQVIWRNATDTTNSELGDE